MRILAHARPLLAVAALFTAVSVQAQSSPQPHTSWTRYDTARRVTGTIAPDPDGAGPLPHPAVRNTYDTTGRLTRVETGRLTVWQGHDVAPANWSPSVFVVDQTLDTTYDVMGRKTRETLIVGGTVDSVTQFSYDTFGRLDCTAVRMNRAAFGSLPAACDLGSQGSGPLDGPDRITRNFYDAAGQLLQERRALRTSLEQPYGTYTYDGNGHRTGVIDAMGNRAELRYDGHGRLRCWLFPSEARPPSFNPANVQTVIATAGAVNGNCDPQGPGIFEIYGYDANGNRTSLRKRDGSTLTFQFDALNRMAAKLVPERAGLSSIHTRDVHYAYDLTGVQTRARFDGIDGEGVTTDYDGFGRVVSSTITLGSFTRTLSYQYDPVGNRTRIQFPDNQAFTYGYDGLNRLTSILDPISSQVITQSYEPWGPRNTIGRHGGASGFLVTGDGRLTRINHYLAPNASLHVTWNYTYNPAGQIESAARSNDAYAWMDHYNVNRVYNVNGLNQYTSAGQSSFSYDANGNLISDGTRSFQYDVENRLVGASGAGAVVSLGYDPLGRLLWTTGNPNYTSFLHDGDRLVAEYNSAGTLTDRYVHGHGVDEPLIWYSNGNRLYLLANHQGTIVGVTNHISSLIATNTYDPWGIPGEDDLGRFRYTGQIWLPELGLYYYKARMYSPTLGRFMQVDPIGYDDDLNLYSYVANDPVNRVDPDGQEGACIYGPSQCGSRQLTADEEQRREETVSVLANIAMVAIPGGALVRGGIWVGRAFFASRAAAAFMRTASSAYRAAASGGRHAGELGRLMNMTTRQVQQTLRSRERTIAQHLDKMAHPERHMVRESASDPAAVARARRDWQRTIDRAREQRDIAVDELRRRSLDAP